eukprot:g1543.t1
MASISSFKFEDYKSGLLEIKELPKSRPASNLLDDLVNMSIMDPSPVQQPVYIAEETLYAFEQATAQSSVTQEDKAIMENGSQYKSEKKPNSEQESSIQDSDSVATKQMERFDRKSNFGVLQDHINVLTEENCELRRALELQQRLTENLTGENQHLSDEYNIQAHQLEELQKKCAHYESLLKEQYETMGNLLHGQETSKTAQQAAQERIKVLVQENVGLEDKLRDVRVSEIRLQKSVEALKSDLASMSKKQSQMENENRNLTDILNNIREENNVLRAQIHKTPKETKVPSELVDRSCQMEDETRIDPSSHTNNDDVLTDDQILEVLTVKDLPQLNTEEASVLASVYELLSALEDQRRAMIAKLRASKAEIARLKVENAELLARVLDETPKTEARFQTSAANVEGMDFNSKSPVQGESRTTKSMKPSNGGWFSFRRNRNAHSLLD